jgi:hypothetical protein
MSFEDEMVNEVSKMILVAQVGFIDGESLLVVGTRVGDLVGAFDTGSTVNISFKSL